MAVESGERVRVLYAEDNTFDVDLTTSYFAEHAREFTLDIARTGQECLARLHSAIYDVLLLDNRLPDMDGEEILKLLLSRGIQLPVVMTTAAGDEMVAVRALQMGVADYVPKDDRYVELLPTVLKNAIADHRAQERHPYGHARVPRRVIYIEHNPSDIDLTVRQLAEASPHITVEVVTSGATALALLDEGRKPDLVLTDLRLRDMSALDILREVKLRRLRVPFIVLTGRGDEKAAIAALKLGAYDYILKRDEYLTRLPYAIENAIARFQLVEMNEHLQRELAERLRLQQTTTETLARLDSLQKHAPIGIAFMDRDFRFQRINDELAAINGLPAEAHLGRTLAEVLPDVWPHVQPAYELALAGELVPKFEVSAETPARPGENRHFIGSFYPVRGSQHEVVGVGVAISEITERRRAETALQEHARALAEAARQKDEFLAMLSHELRNPLAPIRTALGLLRRTEPQDEISATAHDVIDRQVTHMTRLLDDLLDVARITSGRINLNLQDVDLREIVKDATESVGNLLTARRHTLLTSVPPGPVAIRGDVTRLVQVVVNLLNNAAKYTNEGGTITLDIMSEEPNAVVRVRDTGTGIPVRLISRIFDLFTQDERTLDRAQGGLGLGLTLVRRITELHGGTVEAHSEGRGFGSEFIVRLPLLSRDSVDVPVDRVVPHAYMKPRRCLVVEDNVDAARMLELALTIEGHQVRLAFDGRDAVEAAAAFHPDAIILDIGLPRMNGYDAARAIRQLPGLADVHIVAVTGYGQPAEREKSREAGIDDHLVKPIDIDVLLETLAVPPH